MRLRLGGLLACAVVTALVPPVVIAGTGSPASTCQETKLVAAGKEAASELGCQAKAAKAALAVDSSCLGKARTSLTSSFQKADTKGGCGTTGDSATVDSAVGAFVGNVVGLLRPSTSASHCAAAQLAVAGKATSGLLLAEGKNITKPDAGKLSSVISKLYDGLNKPFAKAEASKTPDCLTTGKSPDVWLANSSLDFKVRNLLLSSPTSVRFNNYAVPDLPGSPKLTGDLLGRASSSRSHLVRLRRLPLLPVPWLSHREAWPSTSFRTTQTMFC
jgi:hypothetical protein